MKHRWITLLCLMGLMGSPSLAPAQNNSNLEARKERVHQLIVTRFANGLGLNQNQAKQLGDILKKHRGRKRQLRRQLRQVTFQLREVTGSGNEQQIQETLVLVQKNRDQLDRVDEEMFSEVRTMLSPQQMAQFVLIMDEIRHEIRAVRRQRRQMAPGGEGVPDSRYRRGFGTSPLPAGGNTFR